MKVSDKNKTYQILVFLIGTILICILFAKFIHIPLIKEIKTVKNNIENIEGQIKSKQNSALKLPEMEKELINLQNAYSDSAAAYVTEDKLPLITGSIVDEKMLGKNISVAEYKPMGIEGYNKLFNRQAFYLNITADYTSFLHYLAMLLNNYKGISLQSVKINPSNYKGNLLNISINGYVYSIKNTAMENISIIKSDTFTKPKKIKIDKDIPNIFFNLLSKTVDTKGSNKTKMEEYIKKISSLKIQGIWVGQKKRVIIDNTMYSEGDTINSMMISEISRNQVVFICDGTRLIKMFSEVR